MPRPDVVTSGREDAVRVDGVLERCMEALQRVIVERVHVHDRLLKYRCGSVLAPTVLAAHFDQLLESFAIALVGGRILGDRRRENEDEGALPETGGQGEGAKQGHAKVLGPLAENTICLNDRRPGAGNDR